VYRATDITLKRQVALKVLPPEVANDPERVARFQREAEVLASLNHPNIAHLYGLERSGGTLALVMELVEGPTLADRIAHGAFPIDEALPIAKQIAEALEAAHEQGIVHRDLKPANVKVREDGTVKVLDFGLAKAMEPASGVRPASSAMTNSPTITSPALMTGIGVLLGTAAYMSPEQAKGRLADRRSDLWAFGCVVYELLAGQRTFGGEDVSDTLAHILMKEPDWALLPADTPAPIRRVLARCLARDRKLRLDSAADARLEIEEAMSGGSDLSAQSGSVIAVRRPLWRRVAVPAVASLLSAALVGYAAWQLKPAPSLPVVRLAVPLACQRFVNTGRRGLAVSPDGQQFVYIADRQLHLRKFSQSESTVIKGSDDPVATVTNPVFSPDGQSLAFFADGAIKRVAVTGGTATVVCRASNVVGMSWRPSGLVFSEGGRIKKVTASGGEPELLWQLTQGVATNVDLLPGGRTLLLSIAADTSGQRPQIVVKPLPSGKPKVVIDDGDDPQYLSTGQLIFARGGVLFAVGLDIQRLALNTEPVAVLEGVRRGATNTGIGAMQFAISETGTLAFIPGPASFCGC
jgi:serine/threonine-protein kinase